MIEEHGSWLHSFIIPTRTQQDFWRFSFIFFSLWWLAPLWQAVILTASLIFWLVMNRLFRTTLMVTPRRKPLNLDASLMPSSQEQLSLDLTPSSTISLSELELNAESSKTVSLGLTGDNLSQYPESSMRFRCVFRRCIFRTSDWGVMVDHRHSQGIVSASMSYCSQCSKVFAQKSARDRHVRDFHGRKPLYCPDCLTWAPLRRKDNYVRHRRIRHGESTGAVKPPSTCPPSGYRKPSPRKTRFVFVRNIID